MVEAPSGTVTFPFTDVEGSARPCQADPSGRAGFVLPLTPSVMRKLTLNGPGMAVMEAGAGR